MTKKRAAHNGTHRQKKVLLVDGHAFARGVVARWVNSCDELHICGEVGSSSRAFAAIRRARPDVVVSEILRPDDLGFLKEMHQRYPKIPVVVFSIQEKSEYGARARRLGASGYVFKADGAEKLVRCLRQLLARGKRRRKAAGSR